MKFVRLVRTTAGLAPDLSRSWETITSVCKSTEVQLLQWMEMKIGITCWAQDTTDST